MSTGLCEVARVLPVIDGHLSDVEESVGLLCRVDTEHSVEAEDCWEKEGVAGHNMTAQPVFQVHASVAISSVVSARIK